jgi:hypothetical protein
VLLYFYNGEGGASGRCCRDRHCVGQRRLRQRRCRFASTSTRKARWSYRSPVSSGSEARERQDAQRTASNGTRTRQHLDHARQLLSCDTGVGRSHSYGGGGRATVGVSSRERWAVLLGRTTSSLLHLPTTLGKCRPSLASDLSVSFDECQYLARDLWCWRA